MTTVSFTTVPETFPVGTIAGVYHVTISNSTPTIVEAMNVTGNEAVFTQTLDPGTYVATVQLWDSNNNPIGPVISSEPFTIDAHMPVQLHVPSVVTVTV